MGVDRNYMVDGGDNEGVADSLVVVLWSGSVQGPL